MAPGRIIVAGNLSLDDTITPTASVLAAPGGDALYACLGLRAWGHEPVLLTLVGDDYPDRHLARIAAAGIDTTRVRQVPGPTVHYRIMYEAGGLRRFEWISDEDRLALTSPVADDYAALDGAAWLHLAAMPIEAHETGVAAGRAASVPVSIDPHEEYIVGFEERIEAIVAGNAFMPSELELRLLFPDLAHLAPIPFAFAAAEWLDAWRPSLVTVKLGELGSVVRWRGRSAHVPAPLVPVVDPTGAGDAYCGGFVAGWLASGSPIVAAACGTVAAGETIGAFGAFRDGPEPRPEVRLRVVERIVAEIPASAQAREDLAAATVRLRASLGLEAVSR